MAFRYDVTVYNAFLCGEREERDLRGGREERVGSTITLCVSLLECIFSVHRKMVATISDTLK